MIVSQLVRVSYKGAAPPAPSTFSILMCVYPHIENMAQLRDSFTSLQVIQFMIQVYNLLMTLLSL